MNNKLALYLDTIRRFTTKQFAYWFKNRYLHHFIPQYYPSCTKISPNLLGHRLKTIFSKTGKMPVWDYGVQEKDAPENKYYRKLKRELEYGVKQNKFDSLWKIIDSDPEMAMNFQRFYLFDKAYEEQNVSNKVKLQIIEQWITVHSKKKGMPWSGFNCAIRVINWLRILYKCNINTDSDADKPTSDRLIDRIQQSVFEQALYNYRHIEHHIPGNHVLFQYISIWLVLVIWPEWEKQIIKRANLEKKLQEEINKEFKTNGFHFELSSHYHLQATLFCLIWFDIKKRVYQSMDNRVSEILAKALNVIQCMMLPDDTQPLTGDNCYPFWHAHLNQDIENISVLARQHFGIDIFRKKNTISEIKNDWLIYRNDQQHLMLDVGQIGLSANPGHGHADILNLIYSDAGQPLFIDPGTFLYADDATALECKRTINHNTISVNTNDQSLLWGFFRWAWLPSEVSYDFAGDRNNFQAKAQFSGFNHNGPIQHSRMVECTNGQLVIKDKVVGDGCHDIFLNFVLHPDIELQPDENCIILTNKTESWEVICGGNGIKETDIEPVKIYPAYNVEKISHKIVISSLRNNLPAVLETRITRLYNA